jgi:hypothetical protein
MMTVRRRAWRGAACRRRDLPGHEIEQAMAIAVVGGLVTSAFRNRPSAPSSTPPDGTAGRGWSRRVGRVPGKTRRAAR